MFASNSGSKWCIPIFHTRLMKVTSAQKHFCFPQLQKGITKRNILCKIHSHVCAEAGIKTIIWICRILEHFLVFTVIAVAEDTQTKNHYQILWVYSRQSAQTEEYYSLTEFSRDIYDLLSCLCKIQPWADQSQADSSHNHTSWMATWKTQLNYVVQLTLDISSISLHI